MDRVNANGMNESQIRAALAMNQRKLEARRAVLKKTIKDAAKELEAVETQLSDIEQSVSNLNQGIR